uniref:Uncharacterized protein n=1 Tax=viral metagenome TaxID=1070528 RepID=A0A6M3K643_9ZZZZ
MESKKPDKKQQLPSLHADDGYTRPLTRGELRDKLKSGVPCEVASHVAEMTAIVLEGWFEYSDFSVRKSENFGWTIFEPIKK